MVLTSYFYWYNMKIITKTNTKYSNTEHLKALSLWIFIYFYLTFYFLHFFQNVKRKSTLINSHSHHPLQTTQVRSQLKSDWSWQIIQRYFVFPYFISTSMKKHFLKCTLLLLLASATQLKTSYHKLQELTCHSRWK